MRTFVSCASMSGNSSRVFPACASDCGRVDLLFRAPHLYSALHTYEQPTILCTATKEAPRLPRGCSSLPCDYLGPKAIEAESCRLTAYGRTTGAPEDPKFGTASLAGDLARSEATLRDL